MITRLCHEILQTYYRGLVRAFASGDQDLETVQRLRLREILRDLRDTQRWRGLGDLDYEALAVRIPVADYADFGEAIEDQRQTHENILSPPVVRYEPTSGSVQGRKWIPYTRAFLDQLNRAAGVWLGDVYQQFPSVKAGTHYWSLSWLPSDLRQQTSADDVELFPFYQRLILQRTRAVPAKIARVREGSAAWWATLLFLAADESLSLVSVWSPTFWLRITQDLKTHWPEIQVCLRDQRWGRHEEALREAFPVAPRRSPFPLDARAPDFFRQLWPRLALISAWDSSSSRDWAARIRQEFSWVAFQGKGLWATEGVVTIPVKGQNVLAYHSHFYEFRDLQSAEILPAWKLREGADYQPILWTSSGLLRYALPDRVKVTGFQGKVPCLEFRGRLQSVDMVGEKIDAGWVQELFAAQPQWRAISLLAVREPSPHYALVHDAEIAIDIEAHLQSLHHYRLARELGQLQAARSLKVRDVFALWDQIGKSEIIGQNKIEVLLEVPRFNL